MLWSFPLKKPKVFSLHRKQRDHGARSHMNDRLATTGALLLLRLYVQVA